MHKFIDYHIKVHHKELMRMIIPIHRILFRIKKAGRGQLNSSKGTS